MPLCLTALYLLSFLSWKLREVHSSSQCGKKDFVMHICTHKQLTVQALVYVDTVEVPKRTCTCKCKITPLDHAVWFNFSYNREKLNARNMAFKINNVILNETVNKGQTMLTGDTDIQFSADVGFTGRVCIKISKDDKSNFTIACKYSTSRPEDESEVENSMIMIVVGTATGFVSLVAFTVVILWKRYDETLRLYRGLVCNRPSSRIEKRNLDANNTTENTVFTISDTFPMEENAENEYHYIEPDNQADYKCSGNYECIQDFPASNQFPTRLTNKDRQYDYTTCATANPETTQAEDSKDQKGKTKTVLHVPSNKTANTEEIMYDRTDTAVAKLFLSVNEYHHLSPAVSRKRVAVDTYNTIKVTLDDLEDVEDTDYDVTNLR